MCRFFEPLSSFPTYLNTAFFVIYFYFSIFYFSTHALMHLPNLGCAHMPILGCFVEAAYAVVIDDHEQVFAAGLHQHLRPCKPPGRTFVFMCVIVYDCV